MAYLFSVNKKGTVLFHPDAMNLCPEFNILNDQEKLALVLLCDYDSPYNQLTEQERRHKTALQVFGDNKKSEQFENTIFRNAIDRYKGLQYNPKRELLKVYSEKLEMLSKDLIAASSPIAIKNILDSQERIRKSITELNNELIDQAEAKFTVKGGGTLSFLEQLQSNEEEYKRVIAKR